MALRLFFERTYQEILDVNQYIRKKYATIFETRKRKISDIEQIKLDGNLHVAQLFRSRERAKYFLDLANFDISRLLYMKSLGITEFYEYISILTAEMQRRKKLRQNNGGSTSDLRRGGGERGKKPQSGDGAA